MIRAIEGAPIREAAAVIYTGIREVQEAAQTANAVQYHSYDPDFVDRFGSTWGNNRRMLGVARLVFQRLDDFRDTNLLPEGLHEKLDPYRESPYSLYESFAYVDYLLDNPREELNPNLNATQRIWFLQGRELRHQTYLQSEVGANARLIEDPLAQYYFSIGFRPRVRPYGTDFGVIFGFSNKGTEIPVEDRSRVLEATQRYLFLDTTPGDLQDLSKLELLQPLAMRVLRKLVDEPALKGIVETLAHR